MNKNLKNRLLYQLLGLIFCFLVCMPSKGISQLRKSRKMHEESESSNKMWYGGGINLNFSSDGYNSIFTFGISPMAGYKITPKFSVGPRLSIDYTTAKYLYGNTIYPYNSVDYGAGIFARYKFIPTLFAHIEYSQVNETNSLLISSNGLEKIRDWRGLFLIGIGYNSDQPWAFEIYINYNFLEDKNSTRVPIVYRGGITYNF